MPKRKPWDVPIVKFGKNGDFFVNFSGKNFISEEMKRRQEKTISSS